MTDADEVEQLRAVPVFAGLDEDALLRVAEAASPFEVERGRVLAEHGQPGSGLFVITEGTVEVDLPNGRLISVGPGEIVGELSILADMERVARVRATSTVRGLAISRGAFQNLLESEPRIALGLLPVLARRLAAAEAVHS